MSKILGIGNALVDIMTRLDDDRILAELNLPKGSMQLVDLQVSGRVLEASKHLEKQLTSGGSAANTIYGLSMLGMETAFIGKIGKDEYGDVFRKDLEACGIIPLLLTSETHSGRAIALVSSDSERTFATHLGAAVELEDEDLDHTQFDGYDFFHIEGYLVQNHSLLKKAVTLAKEKNLKVSLDLASYNIVEENLSFLKPIVEDFVDIIFANEEEAKAFTGKEPRDAVHEMAGMCDIAVVKTGEKGSLIKQKDQLHEIGIIRVSSIDTTGAGDLYASGFLFGLVNNYPLEKCGRIGAILAGNIIEVIGARMDIVRWDSIRKLIADL
ncbi:MAG: adenosine kinase [Bacteroidetes bacterium]|nr:adenosine kinase [Bacteroidota bacterium]